MAVIAEVLRVLVHILAPFEQGHDVIDLSGRGDEPAGQAVGAQRVHGQAPGPLRHGSATTEALGHRNPSGMKESPDKRGESTEQGGGDTGR